jgi:uncharacterized protein Usg
MKVGYAEFSFGYAFTENLVRASATAPAGAPVFPNLVQEAHLGYDVCIDFPAVPLFFEPVRKQLESMLHQVAQKARRMVHRLPPQPPLIGIRLTWIRNPKELTQGAELSSTAGRVVAEETFQSAAHVLRAVRLAE